MNERARTALLLAALMSGCNERQSTLSATSAPNAPVITTDGDAATRPPRVVLDMTRSLESCAFGHRGVLLDFGDPATTANLRPGLVRPSEDEIVEHEGATWMRVRSRTLTTSFYWPAPLGDAPEASVYAEARVRGILARAISVVIDGKTIGTWSLAKGETRVVSARSSFPLTLGPGGHELAFRVVGGARASDEPLAEIDWVHIGTGDPEDGYAAPTRSDVVVDATLADQSVHALSLRAPGFVRCAGWIPSNATLEASLATAGGGDAEVEARVLRDRRGPIVLGAATIAGGSDHWVPWQVPVTGIEGDGALASIEIVVRRAGKGSRVLLGDPRLSAAGSDVTPEPPHARGVVVVVLGSTAARSLAPWGGPHAAPELASLAATGTTFFSHRAPSTLASAVLASILTGVSPLVHGVDDPNGHLPGDLTTVQEAARQGSVVTAMFTANPTTGAAFGFARGWDTFVAHDPLEDVPATRVFDDAAAWIDAHRADRFFVLIHARGGHPPWDATADELKTLPPEGYFGMIEPRRAAEALAKARKHPARFKDDDRVRAWALYDRAIDAHDAALGRLLMALRGAGREADTAVFVTGDVAANETAPVPFADPETLDEPLLATPLVARWPKAAVGTVRTRAPTSPTDLARTILDALGLVPPTGFEGLDLADLARGAVAPEQRPLLATRDGRFSARWGTYVLLGVHERELRLCDLSLDPSCVADVRGTSPLALGPLRQFAVDALAKPRAGSARTLPIVDPHTAAALVRWGQGRQGQGGRGREDDF